MTIELSYENGDLNFTLPTSKVRDLDSVFVFSHAKAGSTLIMSIVQDICRAIGLAYVDLPGACFDLGIREHSLPASVTDIFKPRGYAYGGYRHLPTGYSIPGLRRHKSILFVRDPRDCVTSLYYSLAYSHVLPEASGELARQLTDQRERVRKQSIDDFTRERMELLMAHMGRYAAELQANPNMRLIRYEESIYVKIALVDRILRHFGWTLDPETIRRIADRHDIRPDRETPDSHIRQVHPGDHRSKLSADLVARINSNYGEILRFFKYL